jgi:RNA polymerase sigma factor (sigma-70 family)
MEPGENEMAAGPMSGVLRHLRRAVLGPDGGQQTDGDLLRSFLDQRDETAFAALVRRHGPMVLGVCRRVLHNGHDAEDAFQATFLVLVRKAAAIVPREMVGNWLHGVAYRTATKARTMAAKRQALERKAGPPPEQQAAADPVWRDLQPLLDRELHQLPDKYRVPVVLCDLEGKTRTEAARQLGWPEGTLSWRLASARALLAKRLARRGVALSAGALALLLSQQASACVPAPLLVAAVKSATLSAAGQALVPGLISPEVAALTQGVLQTMYWTRLKIMLALSLAVGVLGTGAGIVSYRTLAVAPERTPAAASRPADAQDQALADRESGDGARAADREAPREPRKAPDFQGKIGALSADGKTLTLEKIANRGEEPTRVELKLTDQTKVEFTGVLKDLFTKLKVGDTALVFLQDGSKDTAGLVQAQRDPDMAGKITALAGDGKSFTVEVPSRNRGEGPSPLEIKLTDKTKFGFGRGDQDQKLQTDFVVAVWLQEGSRDTAAAVQAGRRPADVAGEITAISKDGKLLTLQSKTRSGDAITTEIKLTDQTRVEFAESAGDKKLKVGYGAQVWLQEGSRDTAAAVQATSRVRSPDFTGRIAAVSDNGKELTIEVQKRGEDATRMDIKLTDKTALEFAGIDNEQEKKLTVGYSAQVWLQEGSKDTAAVVRATKPGERSR